ncbi:MAG: hypothetical protein VXZ68_04540 [Pseudomonadota bacterium]|nr:hypothetical protein [Pseudomonadota bacterium]MEC8107875.1 hypothetical protein [Pseudomonadota bacterium]MEC8168939.1 hypothetical protein [Pseudomonadota bacterium]MEC8378578.1 hypothetical protein [Pseudomonadota bacterium]
MIDSFPLLVTKITSLTPDKEISSTIYSMRGLSKIGNNSFGIAFVAGNNLVPRPATGIIALFKFFIFPII